MQAYDLLSMRVVAAKVHQLSPAWNEAKKASYVKHAIREVNIQKVCVHVECVHVECVHVECVRVCERAWMCVCMRMSMHAHVRVQVGARHARFEGGYLGSGVATLSMPL